jgi:hypothetical protein
MASINIKDMKDKELFLNVCEALQTGGSNTKKNAKKFNTRQQLSR